MHMQRLPFNWIVNCSEIFIAVRSPKSQKTGKCRKTLLQLCILNVDIFPPNIACDIFDAGADDLVGFRLYGF